MLCCLRFHSQTATMLAMTRTILSLFVCLCWTGTLAAEVPKWTFTEEQLQLFSPPMDATIEQMRTWADRLERPIPNDTEKWGGRDKYHERVALLRIDIAKQIIASEPNDSQLLSLAWGDLRFPYSTLARQDKTNIPLLENFTRSCNNRTINMVANLTSSPSTL